MKKRGLLILTVILLCLAAAGACDSYGTAFVYAKNNGKVHLREEASSDSASLGLFFTGTQVEMRSDPDAKWVKVRIDGASGYIRSAYLRRGEGKENTPKAFWQGVIDAKNYVNFRRGPSKEYNLVGTIDAGERVSIMGETSEGWYYVEHDGDTGYVSKNLIDVTSRSGQSAQSAPTAEPVWTQPTQISGVFPSAMPMGWTHMSGAGAWSTQLLLDSDGFFYGYFSDADASVVYESSFSGRFTDVRRRDAYSYVMTLSTFHIDGTIDEAVARNGILYITKEPAGLAQGDAFVLYAPGTPRSRLTQEELSWLQDDEGNTLDTYFLCNQNSGRGFVPGTNFQ